MASKKENARSIKPISIQTVRGRRNLKDSWKKTAENYTKECAFKKLI